MLWYRFLHDSIITRDRLTLSEQTIEVCSMGRCAAGGVGGSEGSGGVCVKVSVYSPPKHRSGLVCHLDPP